MKIDDVIEALKKHGIDATQAEIRQNIGDPSSIEEGDILDIVSMWPCKSSDISPAKSNRQGGKIAKSASRSKSGQIAKVEATSGMSASRLNRTLAPTPEKVEPVFMPTAVQISRPAPTVSPIRASADFAALGRRTVEELQANEALAQQAQQAQELVDDHMVCQMLDVHIAAIQSIFKLGRKEVFAGTPQDRRKLWEKYYLEAQKRHEASQETLQQILSFNPTAQFLGGAS